MSFVGNMVIGRRGVPISEHNQMSGQFSGRHKIWRVLEFHSLTIDEGALVVDNLVWVKRAGFLLTLPGRAVEGFDISQGTKETRRDESRH